MSRISFVARPSALSLPPINRLSSSRAILARMLASQGLSHFGCPKDFMYLFRGKGKKNCVCILHCIDILTGIKFTGARLLWKRSRSRASDSLRLRATVMSETGLPGCATHKNKPPSRALPIWPKTIFKSPF